MWSLETIKQINQVASEVHRQGGLPKDVYPLCGITGAGQPSKPLVDLRKEFEEKRTMQLLKEVA